ncbi:MAG TPA: carbohydrate-binding family 9-like protein [Polyangiaceae bacterium]
MAGAVAAALVVALGVRRLVAARAPERPARAPSSRAPDRELVLHVPHTPGSIILDSDTDDPGWTREPGPARTGPFVLPDGPEARPYSNTRIVWGDGHLYLALYAADEDIESRTDQPDGPLWLDDSFRLTFTRGDVEYSIEVSPRGVVTDGVRKSGGKFDYSWSSGVHVSQEMDGTLNKPQDLDEEWVIEMAIPFESLGMNGERGESIGFSVRRCDTPKDSPRVCAGWGEGDTPGRLVLD